MRAVELYYLIGLLAWTPGPSSNVVSVHADFQGKGPCIAALRSLKSQWGSLARVGCFPAEWPNEPLRTVFDDNSVTPHVPTSER